jgi:hypothetical protein
VGSFMIGPVELALHVGRVGRWPARSISRNQTRVMAPRGRLRYSVGFDGTLPNVRCACQSRRQQAVCRSAAYETRVRGAGNPDALQVNFTR